MSDKQLFLFRYGKFLHILSEVYTCVKIESLLKFLCFTNQNYHQRSHLPGANAVMLPIGAVKHITCVLEGVVHVAKSLPKPRKVYRKERLYAFPKIISVINLNWILISVHCKNAFGIRGNG